MMIRKETSTDIQDIRRLNDLVFAGPVEGIIVDAIRDRCPDALSLVAVEGTQIIGHIFFSPVAINGMNGIEAMGLGPMAVLPEYQRKGIGKALITNGIQVKWRRIPMNAILRIFASVALVSFSVSAQQAIFQDPLLDHFVGKWVLQGTIDGKATTHDIVVEWVLGHQYVQFHEVSREKNAQGRAEYEAIVFIGRDQPSGRYACLWLDNTGSSGLTGQSIGLAQRDGDELAFLFYDGKGVPFHTTFAYDKSSDTWQWKMDGEEGGKLQPFARVKLTRK